MRLLALNCEQCGAPLEVPLKVRYATCNYCSARLEVHHAETAAYTAVIEAIESRTSPIARDVELLKKHKELADLDREWQRELAQWGVETHGVINEIDVPDWEPVSFCSAIIIGGVGLFLTFLVVAIAQKADIEGWADLAGWAGIAVLFGILFGIILMAVAVPLFVYSTRKGAEFQRKARRYRRRRERLCRSLQTGDQIDQHPAPES